MTQREAKKVEVTEEFLETINSGPNPHVLLTTRTEESGTTVIGYVDKRHEEYAPVLIGRWNALAGIPNPQEFVEAAKELLKAAEELIAARDARNGDDFLNGKFFRLQAAISKAEGGSNG